MARIEDYGMIGDLQTAALVGRDGSIDWACFPRFDSGACFAALLGTPENGRWLVAPRADAWEGKRRYLPCTLVLETEWETDTGAVRVLDFMPPRGKAPDIVRIVEGLRGHVDMLSNKFLDARAVGQRKAFIERQRAVLIGQCAWVGVEQVERQ